MGPGKERPVRLDEETLVKCEAARVELNCIVKKVISDWWKSSGNLEFSEEFRENKFLERNGRIFFEGIEFTGASKKAIAGALKEEILKGEIFLAVQAGFDGQLFRTGKFVPPGDEEGKIIISGFFDPDYLAVCKSEGLLPEKTIQDYLLQLFYWDVKSQSEKLKRAQFRPMEETDCWVRIFHDRNNHKQILTPSVIYL
jgi:hypothetical protein